MRAYLIGLIAGPFIVLAATYALNQRGPEKCDRRSDISFRGRPVSVESCTGALGLVTREPRIVAFLDQ